MRINKLLQLTATSRVLSAVTFVALVASCRKPIPTAPDREAIAATVEAFHAALRRGDRAGALDLLAPDAQILESGHRQTRAEYENEHLAADIDFAKAVTSPRAALIVRQEGNVAWTSVTDRSKGEFQGRPVDSEGAELMVLSKTAERWQIRAIHWSSHTGGAGH